MKNIFKKFNNFIGDYLGYNLKKINRVGFRYFDIGNPIEATYLTKLEPFLMELPSKYGRVSRWFETSPHIQSPLGVASKVLINDGSIDEAKLVLNKFYRVFDVKNSNEYLGLKTDNNAFRKNASVHFWSYPWSNKTPLETYQIRKRTFHEENLKFGFNSDENIAQNKVAEEKIDIEISRLSATLESFRQNGIKTNVVDPISGMVLIKNNEFRWFVIDGNHRVSVLSGLNFERIPVLIKKIVRREEAKYWPNVKNNVYDIDQALLIFDRFYNANPPPIYDNWINILENEINT